MGVRPPSRAPIVPASELTSLIHLAGFSTGIVLYAMLVVMTSRDGGRARASGESATRLPLLAALLGLVWNGGALVIYGLRDFGVAEPWPLLVAVAFSSLGFLPAVVVHAAAPRGTGTWRGLAPLLAYTLSGVAAVLFIVGDSAAPPPSSTALLVLAAGYLLLVSLVALGRDVRERRAVTVVALAAFAASMIHLRHDPAQADSWFTALVGHHASVPLVMVILYQDYRFAFADLFLRRALSVILLVCVAVVLHVTLAEPLLSAVRGEAGESLLATAGHIALWVGTALLYPMLYRWSSRVVDQVILRRGNYAALRHDVIFATSRAETVEEAAEQTCRILSAALGGNGTVVRWRESVEEAWPAHPHVTLRSGRRDQADVSVPTSERPSLLLQVGPLPAGRHLLSDEVALLESLATVLGRRVDVLRVARERFERDLRERDITQLAVESELRALRAQLYPHFLFNALTTLGYLMQTAPDRALGTLYRLTGLLRAVLRGPAGEDVTLGEEIEIVEAYLAIEKERFQERLTITLDVPESLRDVLVPPLLLQPLVENAIKHGISPLRRGGAISVVARGLRNEHGTSVLEVVVADTGAGLSSTAFPHPAGHGVGLTNIRRRLDRLYGAAATFTITGAPGRGAIATIHLPADLPLAFESVGSDALLTTQDTSAPADAHR